MTTFYVDHLTGELYVGDCRVGDTAATDAQTSEYELSHAKSEKNMGLETACKAEIVSGFTSSALGSTYTYPCGPTEQDNLTQSAANGEGKLWCKDSTGTWSFLVHTQLQAEQVLSDFITCRNEHQSKLITLKAQVEAATTVDAVSAIVWS